jgi:DNA-directed RNA polymerase sigma subunit (sigma70/sigma32)
LGLSRERVRQIQKKALEKIMAEAYPEIESDVENLI